MNEQLLLEQLKRRASELVSEDLNEEEMFAEAFQKGDKDDSDKDDSDKKDDSEDKDDSDKKYKKKDKKKDEDEDDEEDEDEEDDEKAKLKTESEINTLFSGETLSEEFKVKTTALFEASIGAHKNKLNEAFDKRVAIAVKKSQITFNESISRLESKVENNVDQMVEEWASKHELAIERGIKANLFESFIQGMTGLMREHQINIPDDKIEILESRENDIEFLESKVEVLIAENAKLSATVKEASREKCVNEAAEGLSSVEREKFVSLVEEISYKNSENFVDKLQVIREEFFNIDIKPVRSVVDNINESYPGVTNSEMFLDAPGDRANSSQSFRKSENPAIAALAAHLSRGTV